MKKLHLILCTGLVALSALSCKRDDVPAAPMTPTAVQQKLADVALAALKEIDPDNWKDWGQTGMGLINEFQNLQSSESFTAFLESLEDLFSQEKVDPSTGHTTLVTVIKLSQLTGDITVSNNTLNYAKSSNPLNLTMSYQGKTYKAQVEAKGESSTPLLIFSDDDAQVSLYVPGTAGIHVTENGSLFMDLVLQPVIQDNNQDGQFNDNDTVGGSVTIQIPQYQLSISNLEVSEISLAGVLEFAHSGTSVFKLDGKVEFDYDASGIKDGVKIGNIPLLLDDVAINSLSVMGGQAIVKGVLDLQDIKGVQSLYSTEDAAKAAAKVISKSLTAELYFDNNSTVQASFVPLVTSAGSEGWNVLPGVHFADGSPDQSFSDFINPESSVWTPVKTQWDSILQKISNYFENHQTQLK